MTNREKDYEFIKSQYYKWKESGNDDWEQKFFDAIDEEFNKDEYNYSVFVDLIYYDDNSDIVESLMSMVKDRRVLFWNRFYDESRQTDIVYVYVEK